MTATLGERIVATGNDIVVQSVMLSGTNSLSSQATPIPKRSDGIAVYSYERWLRVSFDPAATSVGSLRFWLNGYLPIDGWTVRYGLSTSFTTPTGQRSTVALQPPPVDDPGISNLTVTALPYSDWLVFQARYVGPGSVPIQTTELDVRIAWTEYGS